MCTHDYCVEHRSITTYSDCVTITEMMQARARQENAKINWLLLFVENHSSEWQRWHLEHINKFSHILLVRVYGRQSDQKNFESTSHRRVECVLWITRSCKNKLALHANVTPLGARHLATQNLYRCNESMIWWLCGTYKPITAYHYDDLWLSDSRRHSSR